MNEMFEGFGRRFAFFSVGLVLGSALAYFFFGSRDIKCSYFPNDRVLNDMSQKELFVHPEAEAAMRANGIDSLEIKQIFRTGKVDFKASKTDLDSCKEYVIASRGNEPGFKSRWANCDSVVRLLDWSLE